MKDKTNLTLPLLNTSILAMVVMTILIASSVSLLLYKEYSTTLRDQQKQFSLEQSMQLKNATLKSIKNYQTILEDYSNFPLLRLAVMQPDSNLEDAIDLMKSFSFLGDSFPMGIYDFEGHKLHDFFNSEKISKKVEECISTATNLSTTQNIELDQNLYLISIPIVLKDSVEGSVCILVPTKDLIENVIKSQTPISHYEIYNGEKLISDREPDKVSHDFIQFSTVLFDNIKIVTFIDPSSHQNAQNALFNKLLLSIIIIITLISLLTFLFINRFLLKPIVSLGELTNATTQKLELKPNVVHSPIKELSLLRKDIETMIHTVNQRTLQLNESNNKLELRVKERTKELEQKAEELEKLSKYKSEFLARMSHEIRTPMNAIIGYTDILKESVTESENLSQLKIISSSADALLMVINDILDFSKIEAGMMSIEKIPFNLNQILNDINHLFSKSADDKGLDLNVELVDEGDQWLEGDPHRIRQILINLTGNAIKFTHRGSVSIRTETSHIDKEKVKIDIVIEDSGIGIPQNKVDVIFKSFSQAEGSVSRQYGGTGLGLPISKELTELMGGSLNVFSKEGEGTTFRFSLILTIAEPVKNIINQNTSISWAKTPKVLLVDDNIVNIKLAEKTLKNFNVDYKSCNSGITALETLRQTCNFDLILMDCQMPQMDGLEATRQIRKMTNLDSIPVIAFTANAMEDEINNCYKAGMVDYISKPFKKEIFNEKLRKWLKHLIENIEEKAI